ncbi:MAG: RNA 2',3'-cyclic phosphodiesterase [Myxococcota bacterium]
MGEFIRTFIAIEPDEEARDRLTSFVNSLKGIIRGDINWTRRENLHFTLKFLGEISFEKIEEVTHLLNNIAGQHKSFEVSIQTTGFFPDSKRPRIFWAGIEKGRDEILTITNEIESDCVYLGFERERREFKAHLTLARIRDPRIRIDLQKLEELSREEICRFNVDRIILYRSDLLRSGAKYTIIKDFRLK